MRISKSFPALPLLLLSLLLNACAENVYAPVTTPGEKRSTTPKITSPATPATPAQRNPAYHVVARGDTLYSVAFNYGFDYRDVAAWNNIDPPYIIYPGQQIKLQTPALPNRLPQNQSPPGQPPPRLPGEAQPLTPGPIVSKHTETKPEIKPQVETGIKTTSEQPVVPEKTVPPEKETVIKTDKPPLITGPLQWSWPAQGQIVKSSTPISQNGIDIAGNSGQQINAAAAGEVVYSGSGLLGYGRLIIIKHNETYLSAYAHNDQLLVKEGERVAAGQNIARMGQTNDGRTLLHFEIRKNGQPVDPLSYLPKL